MKATLEQFLKFRKLQNTGIINMNDIDTGCELTGLSKELYIDIMWHYEEYLREL